jgi:hypothetical protein
MARQGAPPQEDPGGCRHRLAPCPPCVHLPPSSARAPTPMCVTEAGACARVMCQPCAALAPLRWLLTHARTHTNTHTHTQTLEEAKEKSKEKSGKEPSRALMSGGIRPISVGAKAWKRPVGPALSLSLALALSLSQVQHGREGGGGGGKMVTRASHVCERERARAAR